MTYIGEEFQKRYNTLPEDIQDALTAVASVDTIFAIGKKHGLMVDQIGKMADEIWKVMLGLANPKDFIRNLASSLGIESEKASAIASEANAQMFQQVRESLRRIYDEAPQQVAGSMQQAQHFASSLRATEGSEAIPQSKDEIAEPVPSKAKDLSPRNDSVSPMIYPQDRFKEEFKKEPAPEMFDTKGRTKEAPVLQEQLAPPPPMVSQQPPSTPSSSLRPREAGEAIPQSKDEIAEPVPSKAKDLSPRNDIDIKKEDDFTYPEKTKEISREPAASQGGYKSRDPYREAVE